MVKKMTKKGTVRGRLSDGAPNPIDVHVGGRVREARKLFGLSQEALAEALGITFQQVQKYEKGQNRIGASRLWDLAQVFGVSVDFFYENLDETSKKQSPRQINCGELHEGNFDDIQDLTLSRNDRELIQNFKRIQNPYIAHSILELVKSVAENESLSLELSPFNNQTEKGDNNDDEPDMFSQEGIPVPYNPEEDDEPDMFYQANLEKRP